MSLIPPYDDREGSERQSFNPEPQNHCLQGLTMNKHKVILIVTAVFLSCNVSCQSIAQPTGLSTRLNSSVHLGDRIQAGKGSLLRLGSACLRNSKPGSSLTMNSRVRIGGPVTLKKNARFQAGSLTMDNGYIGGSINFHGNVDIRNSVTIGERADVGIGGVEIVADQNYAPQMMLSSTTLQRDWQQLLEPRTYAPGILSGSNSFPVSTGKSNVLSGSQTNNRRLGKKIRITTSVYKDDSTYQMIQLSWCSYRNNIGSDKCTELKKVWEFIRPNAIGLDESMFTDKKTGFHAQLFRNKKTGKFVLGFEGTNEAIDWLSNIGQGDGTLTPQYEEAALLAYHLNEKLKGNLTFTGHSLGGGLASMASMITGRKAETFNAAGLNRNVVRLAAGKIEKQNGLSKGSVKKESMVIWKKQQNIVTTYQVAGELLTTSLRPLGTLSTIINYVPPVYIAKKLGGAMNGISGTSGFASTHAVGKSVSLLMPPSVAKKIIREIDPMSAALHPEQTGAKMFDTSKSMHGLEIVEEAYVAAYQRQHQG